MEPFSNNALPNSAKRANEAANTLLGSAIGVVAGGGVGAVVIAPTFHNEEYSQFVLAGRQLDEVQAAFIDDKAELTRAKATGDTATFSQLQTRVATEQMQVKELEQVRQPYESDLALTTGVAAGIGLIAGIAATAGRYRRQKRAARDRNQ